MSACPNSTFVCPASRTRRSASAADSADRSTLVKRASGLLAASVTVCAPTPQPGLQHPRAGRVGGVAVQQVDERAGLVAQPLALAFVIPVDVAHGTVGITSAAVWSRLAHLAELALRTGVTAGPERAAPGGQGLVTSSV